MSVLAGLGAFAGGVSNGISLRSKVDDIKAKRDKKKQDKEINDSMVEAYKNFEDEPEITGASLGDVVAPQVNQNGQLPNHLNKLNYAEPQNFADGGMVQDESSFVSRVNDNAGLEAAQPKAVEKPAKQSNHGRRLSSAFDAGMNAALSAGRMDMAMQYHRAGFQIRDRLYKEGITNAQRQFEMTGDANGFIKLYNDTVVDGAKVQGYERTPNGYKLKIEDEGELIEREFDADEIRSMVMQFKDPAKRYALERQAIAAREKKLFEAEVDVLKDSAKEKNKVHSFSSDSMLMRGDGTTLHDGSKNRPKFKNEQDVYAAANDPADARHEIAKRIIKQQSDVKIKVAKSSRAPKEASLDRLAYADWSRKPKNANKGLSDYMKEKASWSKDSGLDYVTTSYDTFGEKVGTTRKTKVERGAGLDAIVDKEYSLDKHFN